MTRLHIGTFALFVPIITLSHSYTHLSSTNNQTLYSLTRVRLHVPAPYRHNRGGESARFVIDHQRNDNDDDTTSVTGTANSNDAVSDTDTVYCVTSASALAPLVVLRLVLNRTGTTARSLLRTQQVMLYEGGIYV